MKITPPFFALFFILLFPLAGRASGTLKGIYAESPAHPQTWVLEADKVHQDIRWNGSAQMLFVDVKYSTAAYADSTHPTQYDDFSLPFPTVRFDARTGTFTARGVAIATLRHGFFGSYVALNKGVALEIQRHQHGKVFAMFVPDRNNEEFCHP